MFLHLSLSHSVHRGGSMHGRGAWVAGGACVAGGHVWQGGEWWEVSMAGGACMAGEHAWWGVFMAGGMHGRTGVCGRGCAWQGACVVGCVCGRGACMAWGMHVRGCVAGGACMADTMRYGQWVGGMHPYLNDTASVTSDLLFGYLFEFLLNDSINLLMKTFIKPVSIVVSCFCHTSHTLCIPNISV